MTMKKRCRGWGLDSVVSVMFENSGNIEKWGLIWVLKNSKDTAKKREQIIIYRHEYSISKEKICEFEGLKYIDLLKKRA